MLKPCLACNSPVHLVATNDRMEIQCTAGCPIVVFCPFGSEGWLVTYYNSLPHEWFQREIKDLVERISK